LFFFLLLPPSYISTPIPQQTLSSSFQISIIDLLLLIPILLPVLLLLLLKKKKKKRSDEEEAFFEYKYNRDLTSHTIKKRKEKKAYHSKVV
jgi:hypothetical protein